MSGASTFLGSAGEHFVMSVLLHKGYIAALAPAGAPNVDILVSRSDGSRLCSVQVKARSGRGSDGGWHMRPKHEKLRNTRLFYCFVDFSNSGEFIDTSPDIFVLPSAIVADALSTSHAVWLKNPGKDGYVRKDNPVRRLLPDYSRLCAPDTTPYVRGWLNEFKSAWDLIARLVEDNHELDAENL
jgi:Holliday junction resolvase-like predicted endonuclease